jgi:glycosyltransferase involved in cell wall biosynthesis
MKIAYIVASMSPEWGGPPRAIQGLTEALSQKGVNVSIFTSAKKGEEDYFIRPKGVEMKISKATFLSKIWKIHSLNFKTIFSREILDFDIVHIHEIWHYSHFIAYRLAKKTKKPFIITIHGSLDSWCLKWKFFRKKIFANLIQKRILKNANVLHALTQKEAEDIRKFINNDRIKIIPNGIDPKEFQNLPDRSEIEKKYPEIINKKVILFLGRIHPKKGLNILAEAFGEISKNKKDLCLFIAGPDDNGYKNKIKSILAKKGVLNKVIFSGSLIGKDKLAALSRADIFVLPSYSEGFSITVLEAMASALPVIITEQCNFPEIAEKEAGIVIKSNTNELIMAINKLLENHLFANKLAQNGQKLLLEKFTWDKIADQMMDLYKNILKGKINKYDKQI